MGQVGRREARRSQDKPETDRQAGKVTESHESHVRWGSASVRRRAAGNRPPPGNSESAALSKGGCYHLWGKSRCPGHRGLMLILQPSTRVNDSCVGKKPPVLRWIISAQLTLTTWRGEVSRRQYVGLAILQSAHFLNVHSAQCPVHGAVLNIQINKAWSVSVDEMFT